MRNQIELKKADSGVDFLVPYGRSHEKKSKQLLYTKGKHIKENIIYVSSFDSVSNENTVNY